MRSCLPYADFVIYQKSCCDYNTATNFCLPEIFKYMRFLRCSGIYFFTWNLLLQFTIKGAAPASNASIEESFFIMLHQLSGQTELFFYKRRHLIKSKGQCIGPETGLGTVIRIFYQIRVLHLQLRFH